MNFFERQKLVRRQAAFLIVIFAIALVIIVITTSVWVAILIKLPFHEALIYSGVGVVLVVFGASAYRTLSLQSGGSKIALQLGATALPENISNYQEIKLRNVVEEIAIASGAPMPDIFILNSEDSINAFASGYSMNDAAITVTRGALSRLNRDELQGVIAHEFSHITNGDMRLNTKLVGLLFGISMIGLVGSRMLRARIRGKNAAGFYLLAFGLLTIGFIGLVCSRMIKAGINRQREYLADACAVQYTRQNLGIANALKKIGGIEAGSRIANPDAPEYAHMFFGQGVTSFYPFMETHPPLIDRIQALEPGFSDEQLEKLRMRWLKEKPDGEEEDRLMGFAVPARERAPTNPSVHATPVSVIQKVGTSDAVNYTHASTLIHSLPDNLLAASRNYYAVIPLLYALLCSQNPIILAKQNEILQKSLSKRYFEAIQAFHKTLLSLNQMQWLPLALLAAPALRQHSKEKLSAFTNTINAMMKADDHISLYEYLISHLITQQVADMLCPANSQIIGTRKLSSALPEVSTLMSVMALASNSDSERTLTAYQTGMTHAAQGSNLAYQPITNFAVALDPIWATLNRLNADGKQLLLGGLVSAINHDNVITIDEANLLRTVCASLHIPLPMLRGK